MPFTAAAAAAAEVTCGLSAAAPPDDAAASCPVLRFPLSVMGSRRLLRHCRKGLNAFSGKGLELSRRPALVSLSRSTVTATAPARLVKTVTDGASLVAAVLASQAASLLDGDASFADDLLAGCMRVPSRT